MKRAVAIFILLLYVYNLAGYLILCLILQSAIRADIHASIRAGLPDTLLTVVRLPSASITDGSSAIIWIDENEFCYRDSLYDVVRSYARGDSTYYVCLKDIDEARIISSIDRHIDQGLNDSSRTSPLDALQDVFKDSFSRNQLFPEVLACFGHATDSSRIHLPSCTPHSLDHPPHLSFV